MIKKQNIIAVLATLLLGLTVLTPAYAAQSNTSQQNFFSQLVTFISQKFGLDKTQVQNAVTQFKQQKKTENQQKMQDREQTRLDQLVKDGKITKDQENAILKELTDLRAKYNSANMKNLTPDERQKQIQAEQNELKSWEQTNGIDPLIIMPVRPSGMPRPSGMIGPKGRLSGQGRRGASN